MGHEVVVVDLVLDELSLVRRNRVTSKQLGDVLGQLLVDVSVLH